MGSEKRAELMQSLSHVVSLQTPSVKEIQRELWRLGGAMTRIKRSAAEDRGGASLRLNNRCYCPC